MKYLRVFEEEHMIPFRRMDDFHLHLRQGQMLVNVLPQMTVGCARAIVMPNTEPPILTGDQARAYREEILLAAGPRKFLPLMTIQVTDQTTPEIVRGASKVGVIAGKVYPKGMTTNSENGVLDYEKLFSVFQEMEEVGMKLLLHGESPKSSYCLDREADFLEILREIIDNFPRLRIVLEHVSTAAAVKFVANGPDNLAATVTVHHLFLTTDDVIGGKLKPHNFCKPVAKRPEDRDAIREVVRSGHPRFFHGSDSAPHLKGAKECSEGCAGVYVPSHVGAAVLGQLFLDEWNLSPAALELYMSTFGADHYRLPLNQGQFFLERKQWTVKDEYHGVVPFMAGQTLEWRVVE